MRSLSENDISLREWIKAYCKESNSRRIPKEVILQVLDYKLAWAKSWKVFGDMNTPYLNYPCDDCGDRMGVRFSKAADNTRLCKDCLLTRAFGEAVKN